MAEKRRKNTRSRSRKILLGLATQEELPNGEVKISLCWGRIALVLSLLLVIGWISTTSALYAYLKYKRGFETVNFTETLFLQRAKIKVKMGDHTIQESIAEIEAGNFSDAFRMLHFGIARSPGNLEGRKLIAEFYELGRKRPAIAAGFLLEGLEHGGIEDVDYTKQLVRVLLRNEMDDKIQEIADEHLPEEPELTTINRVIALAAANANYQRGNLDRAEDYLINYKLIEAVDGLLIFAKMSWDRGNRMSAITKLEQMLSRFPNSDPILAQLSNYYREIGNTDKARRYVILRNVKDPSNYKPRLELIYIYNLENEVEREESEIESFFKQFGSSEIALAELANFAVNTGNTELAKRIQTTAIENEFDEGLFTLQIIESLLTAKEFEEALNFTEALVEQQSEWLMEKWTVFNGLRSAAAFAMSRPDLGEVYLQNFLNDTDQNPQAYLGIAQRFSGIDRIAQARKILTVAYEQFPKSQRILSQLVKAELDSGNAEKISELLTQLLKMRRPQMDLLDKAYRELGSDQFIFAQNRDTLLLQLGSILRESNQNLSPQEATL